METTANPSATATTPTRAERIDAKAKPADKIQSKSKATSATPRPAATLGALIGEYLTRAEAARTLATTHRWAEAARAVRDADALLSTIGAVDASVNCRVAMRKDSKGETRLLTRGDNSPDITGPAFVIIARNVGTRLTGAKVVTN